LINPSNPSIHPIRFDLIRLSFFSLQSPAALLGQLHQKSRLCLRYLQDGNRRLVSVSHRTNFHGLVLDGRAPARQGFPLQQTPLRQRYPQVDIRQRHLKSFGQTNSILFPGSAKWCRVSTATCPACRRFPTRR